MDEIKTGRGKLVRVDNPDLAYDVNYDILFRTDVTSARPFRSQIQVDMKVTLSLIAEVNQELIPEGEYTLIDKEGEEHRIENLGRYVGWQYLGTS